MNVADIMVKFTPGVMQGKTSMMWPSQNFLLYIGTIIKIKANEGINN